MSTKSEARELLSFLLKLAVVVLLIRTLLVSPFNIPSESMQPRLLIGDYLLVSKWPYGYSRFSLPFHAPLFKGRVMPGMPERGDVVVFAAPRNPKEDWIKRVIGLPGDVITVRDKRLYRNGMPVEEKYIRYEQPNIIEPIRDNFGPVTVPPDKYFVMGDNRDNSLDSRFWGFVDRGAIQAKAWRIYWSWDDKDNSPRWSRIGKAVR